jgi:ADP-ribose pyrophosphatase YjhB (NUDIX family)
VLPGGGVEAGEDPETALARELREAIAATADIHSLVHVLERDKERQLFYLGRVRTWSADTWDRTGPECADPARGAYYLKSFPLTATAVAESNLKPDAIARLVLNTLHTNSGLFTLADLRAGVPQAYL